MVKILKIFTFYKAILKIMVCEAWFSELINKKKKKEKEGNEYATDWYATWWIKEV